MRLVRFQLDRCLLGAQPWVSPSLMWSLVMVNLIISFTRCYATSFNFIIQYPVRIAPMLFPSTPWGVTQLTVVACLFSPKCASVLSVCSSMNIYVWCPSRCHTSQKLPTLQLLSTPWPSRSVLKLAECGGSCPSFWRAEAGGS